MARAAANNEARVAHQAQDATNGEDTNVHKQEQEFNAPGPAQADLANNNDRQTTHEYIGQEHRDNDGGCPVCWGQAAFHR
ncbi:hypothetical protein ACMFMG_004018 [Clarireedia jacksonii]